MSEYDNVLPPIIENWISQLFNKTNSKNTRDNYYNTLHLVRNLIDEALTRYERNQNFKKE